MDGPKRGLLCGHCATSRGFVGSSMMVRLQRSLARADLTRARVAVAVGAVFWRYLPQITRGLLHLITLQSGGLGLGPDITDLHPDSLIPLPLSFLLVHITVEYCRGQCIDEWENVSIFG